MIVIVSCVSRVTKLAWSLGLLLLLSQHHAVKSCAEHTHAHVDQGPGLHNYTMLELLNIADQQSHSRKLKKAETGNNEECGTDPASKIEVEIMGRVDAEWDQAHQTHGRDLKNQNVSK